MTAAHARALLTSSLVHVEARREVREARALTALARHALHLSPWPAPDPPDGLLLDITGCAHLFGGEWGLGRAALASMSRLGFDARAAIASTFGCAWALARFGDSRLKIIAPGGEREALEPLPPRALRIDSETEAALADLGIERVSDLLELPRGDLASRYGERLLLSVDRALGSALEIISPVRPAEDRRVERAFAGPATQLEGIMAAAQETLRELCAMLERQDRGVRALEARFVRVDAEAIDLRLTLSRSTRDARHIWSLLAPRIERINLGYGVELISLCASQSARLAHQQGSIAAVRSDREPSGGETQRLVGELIDTLVNRLGGRRVLRVEPVASHQPERAFRRLRASEPISRADPTGGGWKDRPSILFDHPEPAGVVAMSPDGPIARIEWRGRALAVRRCIGPERVSPEWWREGASETRDWFAVEDEAGRWLWILRENRSRAWFVHGVWA